VGTKECDIMAGVITEMPLYYAASTLRERERPGYEFFFKEEEDNIHWRLFSLRMGICP